MRPRILGLLILFLLAGLPRADSQPAPKIPAVGFLAPQGRSLPLLDAFRQGLAELGYVEGRSIVIEPRFAEGQYERFPELISELLNLNVDVLAVTGAVTARAAKKAAPGIPLVFTVVVDPVADNVVPSLNRPGGNISGVTTFDPQQATRQLELLKKVIPKLKRVAILGDQGVSEALMRASEEQARALGLEARPLRVAGPNPDLEGCSLPSSRDTPMPCWCWKNRCSASTRRRSRSEQPPLDFRPCFHRREQPPAG